MRISLYIVAASMLTLAACSGLEQPAAEVDTIFDGNYVEKVTFKVNPIINDDIETRAAIVPVNDGVNFAWEATDTVGIYPDKGSQVYFEIQDGVGTSSVSFDGGGWALKRNNTYVSYYPFVGDIYLKRDKIPVSFTGQKQTGTIGPFNGTRYFLATEPTSSAEGRLTFIYNTLNTIIKVIATLPTGSYSSASLTITEPNHTEPLFVENGTYSLEDGIIVGNEYSKTLTMDLEDFTLTEQATVPFYFIAAPIDLTGKKVTVIINSSDGKRYKCDKTPGGPYRAGHMRGLTCVMERDADIISFADPEVKRICVENWDTDGDGELDMDEAAAVTDLDQKFRGNTTITSFDELQYFTGLTCIGRKVTYSWGEAVISYDFEGCTNLNSVIIPENVETIGSYAFDDCTSLSSIIIPKSVKEILPAFENAGLTSLSLPEGSSIRLHESAFRNCMSLSTVNFGGEISLNVEEGVFAECPISNVYFGKDFDYIILPDNNRSLFFNLFKDYNDNFDLNICSIEVSSQNQKYDSRNNSNALIETATNTLILGCKNSSIPESVTCIGSDAFSDLNGLTSFVIPASVTSIEGSFDVRLTSITVQATTPPATTYGPFSYNYQNYDDEGNTLIPSIYVPAGSVNAYKTAPGWSRYADYIRSIEGGTTPGAGDDGND